MVPSSDVHRAAEVGSIDCAKILLEYNADVDALNFSGQTAFHVVKPHAPLFRYRPQRDRNSRLDGSSFKTGRERTAAVAA